MLKYPPDLSPFCPTPRKVNICSDNSDCHFFILRWLKLFKNVQLPIDFCKFVRRNTEKQFINIKFFTRNFYHCRGNRVMAPGKMKKIS